MTRGRGLRAPPSLYKSESSDVNVFLLVFRSFFSGSLTQRKKSREDERRVSSALSSSLRVMAYGEKGARMGEGTVSTMQLRLPRPARAGRRPSALNELDAVSEK